MLSLTDALVLSSRLVALSIALQTLELLALRRAFSAEGVFATGPRETGVQALFGEESRFMALLGLQLALASYLLLVGPSPLFLVLFASYLLVVVRLAGPFNGGSDALSALSLLMLGIAAWDPLPGGVIRQGALAYLGVQLLFSYFVAGLAKLKEAGWRNGRALVHFASLPKYGVPRAAQALLAKPLVARGASWTILLFECSFPLAFLGERACLAYLACGACFHLLNAALFGLNRFFFAWIALYPILLALTGRGLSLVP